MTDFEFQNTVFPMLEAAYPRYCAGLSADRRKSVFKMWVAAFWRTDVRMVEAALQSFICTDSKGFPPVVGQVWERIFTLFGHDELTEAEAWNLVVKAVRRSDYDGGRGAKEAFAALPPTLQKCVGDARQLREWAATDKDELNTVIASNFQRSYRAVTERERAYGVLPPHMRDAVDKLTAARTVPALEGGVSNGQ